MVLSEKMTLLRKQVGMSQEQLAEQMGLSRQAIYKWEAQISNPELDNIKKMAKIFNVSFDVLLDDGLEIGGIPTERVIIESPKPKVPRAVFVSGYETDENKKFYDSGYNKKAKAISKQKDILKNLCDAQLAEMNKKGYTSIIQLHPYEATYFFADTENDTIGIFFNGCEQFVCPIESIVDVSVNSNGQRGFATINEIVIKYFDEGYNIKTYVIKVCCPLLEEMGYVYRVKSIKDIELKHEMTLKVIGGRLESVKNEILGYKEKGERIKQGAITPKEISYEGYEERAKACADERKAFEARIDEKIALENKKKLKKTLIKWGILAGIIAILVICVVAFGGSEPPKA